MSKDPDSLTRYSAQPIKPVSGSWPLFSIIFYYALLVLGALLCMALLAFNSTGAAFDAASCRAGVKVIFVVYLVILGVMVSSIPMMIVFFTTIHRAWRSIQYLRVERPAQSLGIDTPTVAVGLMFCPYFNCYWIFASLLRLEKYGRLLSDVRGLPYRGPERSAIILYLVLCMSVVIPVLGWAACLLVTPVLWYSLMRKFNNMIEDLGKPAVSLDQE